ncbi:carboxylating nicotinate-nucleotide diphosphorylase [Thalassotalea marina]|uniref:nicotinate-nucleotide diphosphorylase (carboxylating) n=1 Tax=Thalassotalea marina TaxID=1673741 RepID=A0A919BCJ8_9GAMM|nr:carboxylating nicotinate-nucleotide diphosphorylase [Thalassotalea marina]GHF79625.1 nicotinate-nucleotide diphosphorylase [Thalassotalea marina]
MVDYNNSPLFKNNICNSVTRALCEDLGVETSEQLVQAQDITAELIPSNNVAVANVISRDPCIVCGVEWVNQVFHQLDKIYGFTGDQATTITWFVNDGQAVKANTSLFEVSGNARLILTGERTALNFLQTLSATATVTSTYVEHLKDTNTKLLDTRKTIPGMRLAQKYAVTCGGGVNHRIGLYDAFLIKENHIAACGGITKAIETARVNHANKTVEVEVESIEELTEALNAGSDIIMLDNFTPEMIEQAVTLTKDISGGKTKLEVSGNMTLDKIRQYTKAGVDYISVGAITKHLHAVDLSMRFV